jgi:hypothetical protein
MPGQNGGRGGIGKAGTQGVPGSRGSNSVQGAVDCRFGGGDGGPGRKGALVELDPEVVMEQTAEHWCLLGSSPHSAV